MESDQDKPRDVTATARLQIRRYNIADIKLPSDGRQHDDVTIAAMGETIGLIGLHSLPSVDGQGNLIRGLLRVLGAIQAGLTTIDCFVIEDTKVEKLWKISENLHRNELTVLERSVSIIQWAEEKGVQVDQHSVGGRGQQGGLANAARKLNMDRSALRRAAAIASIPLESRVALTAAKLDNDQSKLLSIAAMPPEKQLETISAYAADNAPPTSRTEMRFQNLVRAWDSADKSVKSRFIAEVITPYSATS